VGAGHAHSLYVHGHTRVHDLPPHVKVAAAVAFVFAVAVTPRSTLWPYAVDAVVLAAVVRAAGLRPGFVATRAMVVLPFVGFALLIPFVASGERVDVLGVSVSEEGLRSAAHVLAKALLGVTTSVVLAATTELPRILSGLDRLRVPPVLTQIAGFMLRYLEVVAGELRRMRTSMTARGYDPRWIGQARPIAAASGALFVRSYERGERVHRAMLARGYTGTMPALHDDTATAGDWTVALAPAVLALAAALTGWLL
jgi:cobalt/nickel transport system permease protein